MKREDYIVVLEDMLEEDMRGEYGKDLMYESYEYLMLPADKLGEKLTDMVACRNQQTTGTYRLALCETTDTSLTLLFDSYILSREKFTITPDQPYRRGVSGYRGKYHYLTFSLVLKDNFEMPKDRSEYKDIVR